MKRAADAIVLALAQLAPAAPAQAALRFERCGDIGFSCARLNVPLDRSGSVPGGVSLAVKRLRAVRRPRRGATFVLAGGPGQSATDAFSGDGLGLVFAAFRNRDLIVYDQRGTGRSGLLRCRSLELANLLNAGRAAGECAASLGARRAFYTTQDSVEDMEAIRRELGVERIAIFGVSYGTKLALAYARRYPDRVERLALDSVVEEEGPSALYLDTFEAMPRVLRSLCRSGCRRFTRDPVADVSALVARLAGGPLRGTVVDARGRRRVAALNRADLFTVLLAGDFDPSLRAAFPGAVAAALRGDPAVLLRLKRRAYSLEGEPPPPRALSAAVYAATTCEETRFPWARGTPPDPAERRHQADLAVAARPDSDFDPFDRATALDSDVITLCGRWPAASAEPGDGSGPLPDVPVLLLEGEDDVRTPEENARRAAAGFPRANLVTAPATGHSVLGSEPGACAARAFDAFFRGRRVSTRCPRRARQFRPRPPPPVSIRAVAPAGARGLRGRALRALALTLDDVSEDSLTAFILDERDPDLARGGGLRGGRYRIDGDGTARLVRVELIPGVRVSGRIRRFGERRQRGRVHLGGRAVPDGVLAVRGTRVRGRLGGRRVRANLAGAASGARARSAAAGLPGPPG